MTNVRSPVEVAILARMANVRTRDLPAMVAIAYRESRFDADALNRNTNGTFDHGLWQINRPSLTPALFDPQANAIAMAGLYRTRRLEPWTFGDHGGPTPAEYRDSGAQEAVRKAALLDAAGGIFNQDSGLGNIGGNVSDVIGGVSEVISSPFAAVTDAISAPFDALKAIAGALLHTVAFLTDPENWIRVAETIAGGVLILVGIWFLFSQTQAGATVNKAAVGAAKTAAVAA